jgi:hypothetical protein
MHVLDSRFHPRLMVYQDLVADERDANGENSSAGKFVSAYSQASYRDVT